LVARSVAAGHANKAIAHDLRISLGSVATYIRRLRSKFAVTTRTDLIAVIRNAVIPSLSLDLAHLTPAEHAIATRLLRGQSYRQIGSARQTSARTIAVQVRSILVKLNAGSRHELAARHHAPLQEFLGNAGAQYLNGWAPASTTQVNPSP
jgi:DNA-binding NarL/FixJ family response regulator